MLNSVRIGVATVAEQDVSRCHRKAPPRLASMHVRQLKEVTLQGRQVDCVMDSPIRSSAAGFGDRCRIHHAHWLSDLRLEYSQPGSHLLRHPWKPPRDPPQSFEDPTLIHSPQTPPSPLPPPPPP